MGIPWPVLPSAAGPIIIRGFRPPEWAFLLCWVWTRLLWIGRYKEESLTNIFGVFSRGHARKDQRISWTMHDFVIGKHTERWTQHVTRPMGVDDVLERFADESPNISFSVLKPIARSDIKMVTRSFTVRGKPILHTCTLSRTLMCRIERTEYLKHCEPLVGPSFIIPWIAECGGRRLG